MEWGLNELINVKHVEYHLVHSKPVFFLFASIVFII